MSEMKSKTDLETAIDLLDKLLGVDVRKPGAAAKLPAVIRIIESLEPAGGLQFPVFPASYAGDGQNAPPVYDLNGIEYGVERETIRMKDRGERHVHQIVRARQCTLDSPQSQANRTEIAFIEDKELSALVPQGVAKIPRAEGKKAQENLLNLPHRIADFRVRLSGRSEDVKKAISDLANGDALRLIKMMPTSIVFGFWDSRGDETQHKCARLLMSRIDAFEVVPCTKHAIYSAPYSKDEFARVVVGDEALAKEGEDATQPEAAEAKAAAKKAFDTMAKRGFTAALSGGPGSLGGVLVLGKIERLALISLTDIARLSCVGKDSEETNRLTNAARRYIFTLAALAEAHPRATGSHRLRSGCELINVGKSVELRGGSEYPAGEALKALLQNRELLIGIAGEAKELLEIPLQIEGFEVTVQSIKADFDGPVAKASSEAVAKKTSKTAEKR